MRLLGGEGGLQRLCSSVQQYGLNVATPLSSNRLQERGQHLRKGLCLLTHPRPAPAKGCSNEDLWHVKVKRCKLWLVLVWLQHLEEDTGLSVGAAWIVSQDRSMWRTLRPSAGQAQQWGVSELVLELGSRISCCHMPYIRCGMHDVVRCCPMR